MLRVEEITSVRFRLGDFVEDLNNSLLDNPSRIDDVMQTYKDFLTRVDDDLLPEVKNYLESHYLYSQNKRIESFISACYK